VFFSLLFLFLQLLSLLLIFFHCVSVLLSCCVIFWCNCYGGWCRGVMRDLRGPSLRFMGRYKREWGSVRGMCVCGDLLCIWVVGSRTLLVENEWQEGSVATDL
jgi:hypothetical protein